MSLLYNIGDCILNQLEGMIYCHDLSHFIIENWPPTPPTKTLLLLSKIITKGMHYKSMLFCNFFLKSCKLLSYSCTDVNCLWPAPQLVDPKG